MRFKKFVVHNYKQHADREQTLEGNLIGIIGPNGSGKSNLLGALQYALSGEQPGFKKDDLLRWGAVEGYVEVEFEHNNKLGRIRRDLHGNGATISYEGAETVRGISKVNGMLDEIMGIDRDLIKQAVFVRQAEIDAILFTDPKLRELSFQRLCGLGEAAKIHKRLGELIVQMGMPANYDTGIAEGEVRLSQLKDRVQDLTAQSYMLAEKRSTINADQVKAEATRLSALKQLLEQMPSVAHHLHECELNDMNLNAQLVQTKAKLPQGVDMAEIDKNIAQCYDLIKMIDAYEMTANNLRQAEIKFNALGNMPEFGSCPYTEEQVTELKRKNEEISRAYYEVTGNLKFYEDLARALSGKLAEGMECPVCGNLLKDAHRLESNIATHRAKISQLSVDTAQRQYQQAEQGRRNHLQAVERAKSEYGVKAEMLSNDMAKWGKQLTQLPPVPYTKDEVQKRILEFAAVRDTFVSVTNGITRLTANLETNNWDWTRCKDQHAKLKADVRALRGVDGDVLDVQGELSVIALNHAQCSKVLAECVELDKAMAQLRGMLGECEAGMDTVTTSLQTLRAKRDEQAVIQGRIKILTDVREWFHYNNGPHTMAASVLADMNNDVNTFLGHFGADYTVMNSDEGVGFRYSKHDHTGMPPGQWPDAYHLSGGQRIQLAVSFRFAAYCMFANKLGLLSLDEPTVYLDDRNVSNFCTLLGPIRELAQKMNLQILISTHERSVLPFMDSIIDLATV